jgi:hypothetical protein
MKLSTAMTLPILPGALRLEVRNGAVLQPMYEQLHVRHVIGRIAVAR